MSARRPSAAEVDVTIGAAYADSARRIATVIAKIPRGKVMTYGQVAEDAGLGRAARLVGQALRSLYVRVPWHRVLGKRSRSMAKISIKDAAMAGEQRVRLEAEGVVFTRSAGVDLERYGFRLNKPLRR